MTFAQNGSGVELTDLPCSPPDAFPQIFDISFESVPIIQGKKIIEEKKPSFKIDAKGATCLKACSAHFEGFGVKGTKLRLETDDESGTEFIKGWWTPEQEARWNIKCEDAGEYTVYISAGSSKAKGKSIISISAGENQLTVPMPGVSAEDASRAAKAASDPFQPGAGFEMVRAGTLYFSEGCHTLTVKPFKLMWGYVFGEVEKILLEKISS